VLDEVFLLSAGLVETSKLRLTVATEIKNVASALIISKSLSDLMIRLTRAMGNMVVPTSFSASDWRDFMTRFFLTGAGA
jgi:hypothetical protein